MTDHATPSAPLECDCGKKWWMHPIERGLFRPNGDPVARRLCAGTLVHIENGQKVELNSPPAADASPVRPQTPQAIRAALMDLMKAVSSGMDRFKHTETAHAVTVAFSAAERALAADAERREPLDLTPLKKACDRNWEDETPQQVVEIAANAIYWRGREIEILRAERLETPEQESSDALIGQMLKRETPEPTAESEQGFTVTSGCASMPIASGMASNFQSSPPVLPDLDQALSDEVIGRLYALLLQVPEKVARGEGGHNDVRDFVRDYVVAPLLAAREARIQALEQSRDEYRTLSGIGKWHDDCRPNRHMAARELAKSQEIINRLADRISELEAKLASAPAPTGAPEKA